MAMKITRTLGTGGIPIWQGDGDDIEVAQGGFALNATGLATDTVIPAGTPLVFDEAARTASFVGGGTLQAAATGNPTTYRVNKNHTLKVGDNFATGAVGGPSYPITAIDTSNAAYDAVTVGTTIGNAAIGANVYASSATGATASAYPAVNGLLYDDTLGNAGESVTPVIRGRVYARRIPYAYSTALAALTGLKGIYFSQSK
jgi:hypothetical protein